ncbi:phospholipase [Coprobacter sp.]
MWYILASIIVLGFIAAWLDKRYKRKLKQKVESGEIPKLPSIKDQDSECCGMHEICEKESLLAAVSKEIEYYDDEELDRFKGKNSDCYNTDEISEFREVLYTLRSEEVAGWVRSLQLRGIELPDPLKDEVLLIIGERRENA